MKTTKERNNEKFGEFQSVEKEDLSTPKLLIEEMVNMPISPEDYIQQGYRCYKMREFDILELVRNLPSICRRNKLEVLVIDNILYIKDTYKYERKNPYTKS